ncbi:MAG: hypothetical protein FWC51_00265 [Proteobacteria bacterium]|nr:hypothetical protein [Pseudomonadota bacterium]
MDSSCVSCLNGSTNYNCFYSKEWVSVYINEGRVDLKQLLKSIGNGATVADVKRDIDRCKSETYTAPWDEKVYYGKNCPEIIALEKLMAKEGEAVSKEEPKKSLPRIHFKTDEEQLFNQFKERGIAYDKIEVQLPKLNEWDRVVVTYGRSEEKFSEKVVAEIRKKPAGSEFNGRGFVKRFETLLVPVTMKIK